MISQTIAYGDWHGSQHRTRYDEIADVSYHVASGEGTILLRSGARIEVSSTCAIAVSDAWYTWLDESGALRETTG